MPIAKIQAPDGRIITLEVPVGATQDQIMAHLQQNPPPVADLNTRPQLRMGEPSLGEDVVSGLKVASNVATGLAGQVVGGAAGLAASPLGFIPGLEGAGDDVLKAVQGFANKFQLGADDPRVKEFGQNLESAVKSVNIPVGGLVGIAELITTGSIDEAVEVSRNIKEKGFGKVLGESVQEAGGSPLVSTISELIPAALTSGLVPKIPLPKGRAPKPKPIATADEALQQTATTISKAPPEAIAKAIKPDPAFFKAADELGVTAEPLASFTSKNPQFVAIESTLASVPASALELQSKAFIANLSKQADEMIQKLGGTIDKGQLNIDFKTNAVNTIENLALQADDAYGALSKVLPKTGRHPASETVGFLENVIAKDLGGVANLPGKLKTMLNDLKPKVTSSKGRKSVNPATGEITFSGGSSQTINPTLGKIDLVRREVGQALNKKSGTFKNTEQGLLKAIYGKLSKDQDAIGIAAGQNGLVSTAKNLIQKRKLLEDDMISLLGKDLNKSLSVSVSGALRGLDKGKVGEFNKVVNAIPKAQRGEVFISMINDVMRGGGVNQQALNATQFTKWFQNINRSPTIKKALFKELPKGSKQALENMFKVTSGISKALGSRIETGRLNSFFDEKSGFIHNLVGKTAGPATAFVTRSPKAGAAVSEFIKQSSNSAKAASELLASPKFQQIIRASVRDGVIDAGKVSAKVAKAESIMSKTPVFRKWKASLNPSQQERLARFGLAAYLFSEKQEQE